MRELFDARRDIRTAFEEMMSVQAAEVQQVIDDEDRENEREFMN
jgi:hypothetical protein